MAKKKAQGAGAREQMVELLSKMNSEGMHYYFTAYSSPESIATEFPSAPQAFVNAAQRFVDAHDALEAEIQVLKDEFDISSEEVEY